MQNNHFYDQITKLVVRCIDPGGGPEVESARNVLHTRLKGKNIHFTELRIAPPQNNEAVFDQLSMLLHPDSNKLQQRIVQLEGEAETNRTQLKALESKAQRQAAEIATLQGMRDRLQCKLEQRKQAATPSAKKTRWTAETYNFVLDRLLRGDSITKIAKRHSEFLGLSDIDRPEGPITSKFGNQKLDEKLLAKPIIVLDDGPMSFLELWKVGFELFGVKWKTLVHDKFDVSKNIAWKNPLSEAQSNQLRHDYRERLARKK